MADVGTLIPVTFREAAMDAMRAIRVAAATATLAAATMTSVTLGTGAALGAPPAAVVPDVGQPAAVVQPVDLGGLPGIASNGASAINDRGDIVGSGYNDPYSGHGFRWSRGVLTALPDTARAPFKINDAGQVAGNQPGRFYSPGFVIRPDATVVSLGFSVVDQGGNGQVLGTGPVTGGGTHAQLWREGHTFDLGAPAGYTSEARAISDNGWILGEVRRSDHQDGYDARWVQGRWVALPTNGFGADINGRGDVVGWSSTPSGDTHATLWQGNRAIDLDPQDPLSTAVAINDAGQILGSTFDPVTDLGHILLWDQGHRIDLGTFGGQFARPIALNGRGDVVVLTSTAAFRWSHGRTVRLAGSGVPTAINNRGQVVGTILRPGGTSHAALWN
ncbi:HAF repeat-containing protein [Frankia sp. AgKG'84/4]